jgi:hypothetical protein
VKGVAVDKDGNTWVAGTFIGDATWGDVPLTAQDKTHTTGFFAKLDANGKVLFAHPIEPSISGNHQVVAERIRVDAAGNAYVVGTFEDQIDIDDVHLLGQANGSMFVLAIDPTGKAKWGIGSANDGGSREEGYDLAIDSAGDVYVAGSYNGLIKLGTLEATAGSSDQAIFVAKYSPSTSQWVWLKDWAGQTANSGGEAHAIALGSDGSVYAGGTIENDVDFGDGRYFTDSNGSFLVKLDRGDGHMLWATSLVPPSDQANVTVRALASDGSGNVFVTGSFKVSAVFASAADIAGVDGGALDAGTHALSVNVTATGEDMFLVKYDSTGNPAWARHAGNADGTARGDDVVFDGANGVYVGGFHQGPTVFDSQTLSQPTGNLFVARYDVVGAIQWVQGNDNNSHAGGEALGLAVPSPTSGVYIGGTYDTDTTLGAFHLNAVGQDDSLVAHMCN